MRKFGLNYPLAGVIKQEESNWSGDFSKGVQEEKPKENEAEK